MKFKLRRDNLWNRLENLMTTDIFFCLCIIAASVGILIQIICSFSRDIWLDEAFTLNLIRHSYSDIVRLTAADVHPPLYYFILKPVADIWQYLLPNASVIYAAKLVSVIPYIILLIIAVTVVRREWGNYITGMWAVCMVGMGSLIGYGVEIRMYSWGMLFVSLAFLYAYVLISSGNKIYWIFFVLFSLAAAYTHYYACISVGIIYILLLILFIVKDRQNIKYWIIASVVTVIGYLPWLTVFISQAERVSESYWISDITIRKVYSYVIYSLGSRIMTVICFIIAIFFIKDCFAKKSLQREDLTVVGGVLTAAGTVGIGIIASILIRPVFVERYMVPALACMWIGIVIAVKKGKRPILQALFSLLAVFLFIVNVSSFARTEYQNYIQSEKTYEFLSDNDNAVYICISDNNNNVLTVRNTLATMSEVKCYSYGYEPSSLFDEVYENLLGSVYSIEEIEFMLNEKENVYLVFYNSDITIDEFLADTDITYTYCGEYRTGNHSVAYYQILLSE